jgi:predicted nucleotidyltransferase component of viral defense system
MADALTFLVEKRHPTSLEEYDQALREVIQEFMLLALWRGAFFNEAAFYGGTALRLFYGLDRFSEDLDFTLLSSNPNFRFDPWFEFIKRELGAQGLEIEIESKDKGNTVQSAFLKIHTKKAFLSIGLTGKLSASIPSNRLIKIKFEADIDPPRAFTTENRLSLEPIPFSVRVLTAESLFAGKYHALLERDWAQRVKGRDWYDLVFFVRKDIPVHLDYLSSKLRANHEKSLKFGYNPAVSLTPQEALRLLERRISELDVESAKNEVYPFVRDKDQLSLWSREFFMEIAQRVRFVG